jgi:hypothetical protein
MVLEAARFDFAPEMKELSQDFKLAAVRWSPASTVVLGMGQGSSMRAKSVLTQGLGGLDVGG